MLYKSKAKLLWNIASVIFAISGLVMIILNWVGKGDIFLTIGTGLATLFFVSKGCADYIDSKYCARKDRSFMRTLSYIFFGAGALCFIVFVIQLITSLI